jgi:hypothetical protein
MSKTSNKVTEFYKNNKFSFEEKPGDNKNVLQIGGKSVEVLKKGNSYHSVYLLYSTYPPVSALAKKVVDVVLGFNFARYLHGGRAEHG